MALQKSVVFMAFGLLLFASTPLLAFEPQTAIPQQTDSVERRRDQRGIGRNRIKHKRLGFGFRELNLSAEQRQQTQAILQRHLESIRGQREELFQLREKRTTGTLTPDDQARAKILHQQLHDAREGTRGELNNLLTAEQRAQLEQFESQRKARREERFKRRQELRDRIPQ